MTKGKKRTKTTKGLRNTKAASRQTKARDMNSKTMFKNPILCSQFLRNNVDIPLLKDIRPEDIEDVSERYRPYLGAEFEADSVKQIKLRVAGGADVREAGEETVRATYQKVPLYLISLIEHKSTVDYNVSMQILRYMVCIWTEYAKEMQRKNLGSPKNKSFRYPPILPIVYYEGTDTWTVGLDLKSRIWMSDIFKAYIPDFTYRLVKVHDYSNEELLSHEDEMSLLMLINKVQSVEDWQEFIKLPGEKFDRIINHAPAAVLEIIESTVWSLCMKMNMTETEALECVGKVKERKMGYLFENMEKIDIQAERKAAEDARKEAAKQIEDAKKEMAKQLEDAKKEMAKQLEDVQKVQKVLEALESEKESEKESMLENMIIICQEMGGTRELAAAKLQEKCGLGLEEAKDRVARYWK